MNKKIKNKTNKLIIMIVIIMLFNFVMPNYSRAFIIGDWIKNSILNAFAELLLFIPDGLFEILQVIFLNAGDIEQTDGKYSIKFSPGTIFAGKIPMFDINFMRTTTNNTDDTDDISDVDIAEFVDWEFIMEKIKNSTTIGGFNATEFEQLKSDKENNLMGGTVTKYTNTMSIQETQKREVTYDIEAQIVVWEGFLFGQPIDERIFDMDLYIEITISEGGSYDYDYGYMNISQETLEENYRTKQHLINPYAIAVLLRPTIATWYKIMQTFALVVLLSILVYIAIRIIINASTKDKAKYKKMLGNWFAAICLLFILHIMISLVFTATRCHNRYFRKNCCGT